MMTRYFHAVLVLVVLVPFIVLVIYLLKRFSGLAAHEKNGLRILKSQTLGAKERLVLVEVEGIQLLLGVTSQSVNMLYRLSKHEMMETDSHVSLSERDNKCMAAD